MSETNSAGTSDDDAMAAEWAAALTEAKPESASELQDGGDQVAPAAFANFAASTGPAAANDINMILDIPVQLTVELGRTRIPIKHILQLAQGSVVELDAQADEWRRTGSNAGAGRFIPGNHCRHRGNHRQHSGSRDRIGRGHSRTASHALQLLRQAFIRWQT